VQKIALLAFIPLLSTGNYLSAEAQMDLSQDNFHAWYEKSTDAKSKIIVVGQVTETGDTKTNLVRAEPQGINPRVLMLRIEVTASDGPIHSRIAFQKDIRYEESAESDAFTDVHIQSESGDIAIKVGSGSS